MSRSRTLTAAILTWLILGACSSPASNADAPGAQTHAPPAAATTDTLAPSLAPTITSIPPHPSFTPTEQGPAPLLHTPTQSALPINTSSATNGEPLCDMAGFVEDVTIPDGTEVEAGSTFRKSWRLRNVGTCTWTSDYRVVFSEGHSLGGPDSAEFVSETIVPGETVDLTVDLTAPDDPGNYVGYWMLENAEGEAFGIGSPGASFWVEINVPESGGD